MNGKDLVVDEKVLNILQYLLKENVLTISGAIASGKTSLVLDLLKRKMSSQKTAFVDMYNQIQSTNISNKVEKISFLTHEELNHQQLIEDGYDLIIIDEAQRLEDMSIVQSLRTNMMVIIIKQLITEEDLKNLKDHVSVRLVSGRNLNSNKIYQFTSNKENKYSENMIFEW